MDVTAKLQAFIAQYTGVITGDTPQNNGQCVGVVEKWLDIFTLVHIWGNAKDLLDNADKNAYTVIQNSPTNAPAPGDIFVFGSTYGGGFGHTGVVTTADINSVTLFEQNDPLGHAPQLKTYNYTGAVGWIHPNIFTPTTNQTITDQQQVDLLNAQIAATSLCQTQLKAATDQVTTLQGQVQTEQDMVKSLQNDKKSQSDEITRLQIQLDGEQKEIITLNDTIETQAKSNKNYGQETLDLTHANKDLTDYLFATADKLGIVRANKKPVDIEEAILTKLESVDLLLKASGLASGLLHQMAQVLQVDDKSLSDKDVADRIINVVKSLQGKLQSLRPGNAGQEPTLPVIKKPNPFIQLLTKLGFWQPKVG